MSNKGKLHWLYIMYADVIIMRLENIYASETKYLKYQQNIENISFRMWNAKIFYKLARSHIHRFFSMLVFCQYTVVYSRAIP